MSTISAAMAAEHCTTDSPVQARAIHHHGSTIHQPVPSSDLATQ